MLHCFSLFPHSLTILEFDGWSHWYVTVSTFDSIYIRQAFRIERCLHWNCYIKLSIWHVSAIFVYFALNFYLEVSLLSSDSHKNTRMCNRFQDGNMFMIHPSCIINIDTTSNGLSFFGSNTLIGHTWNVTPLISTQFYSIDFIDQLLGHLVFLQENKTWPKK